MGIPIEAFVSATPADVPQGGLWTAEGRWWLAVTAGPADRPERLCVLLKGEEFGHAARPNTTADGFALGDEYTWRVIIPGLDAVERNYTRGALVLGKDGPFIWASAGYDNSFAVTLAGEDITREGSRAQSHFPRWHVELVHKERPWEPLARLFSVEPAEAPATA